FRSSRRTLVSSASIFSQRASTARTGTLNEFTTAICLKGRLIDLRRQRELHSLQNHGLRRRVPRGLLLRGREHASHPPGRMHRLRGRTKVLSSFCQENAAH